MGNEKQVKTINERFGEEWWSKQAGKDHKRGNNFSDPKIRDKALQTRLRNRQLKKDLDEIQADGTV